VASLSLQEREGAELDSRISDRRFFDRVEFVLNRQVDLATREHHDAMFEFWQTSSQASGGDPREVLESERRRNVAKEALVLAFKRSNDFVLNGTVPKDLEFLRQTGESVPGASRWRGPNVTPRPVD
jgi:hypothetical protein